MRVRFINKHSVHQQWVLYGYLEVAIYQPTNTRLLSRTYRFEEFSSPTISIQLPRWRFARLPDFVRRPTKHWLLTVRKLGILSKKLLNLYRILVARVVYLLFRFRAFLHFAAWSICSSPYHLPYRLLNRIRLSLLQPRPPYRQSSV